jgi:hypothetical protein
MPVPASSRRTLQNHGRLGARAVDPRVEGRCRLQRADDRVEPKDLKSTYGTPQGDVRNLRSMRGGQQDNHPTVRAVTCVRRVRAKSVPVSTTALPVPERSVRRR